MQNNIVKLIFERLSMPCGTESWLLKYKYTFKRSYITFWYSTIYINCQVQIMMI